MQLIVITPEENVAGELQLVGDLFRSGLRRLHVRKPSFADADYQDYIASIDPVFRKFVVVHGSFALLDEMKLGGIHLSSHLRDDDNTFRSIAHLSPSLMSASFHSWQEVADNSVAYGYVFISPVFDSISKPGYSAAIGLKGAAETKQQLAGEGRHCPGIIGLGGVNDANLGQLQMHGFDGAALLGSIWHSGDPVGAFRQIAKALAHP